MKEVHVHVDKNQEPNGKWLLTIVVEEVDMEGGENKVPLQTNMYFDQEPQIQYRDWT